MESEYVNKFLKYSVEVVNFDSFDDTTNPKFKKGDFFTGVHL